uniref:FHA domain-containing protein n=1 Tax=Spongospora subterranea TaxID=70186 RepID=A0A0H5R3G0_9EUKA|eukprot:CRZ08740.1 hypothetical protein [Spongospora subterranea]
MLLAAMPASPAPAFAVLRSAQGAFFIRKLTVSLGKGDKRGVDLHIGECADIGRLHAMIHFNWSIRRFELVPVGKGGLIVNDLLYAVGAAPIPLDSGDVIQVPCSNRCQHDFVFLLAAASTDRGPYDMSLYRPNEKMTGRDLGRAPWSIAERDRFCRAVLDFGNFRPLDVKVHAELHKRIPYEIEQFSIAFMASLREHCAGSLRCYLDSVLDADEVVQTPEVICSWRQLRKSAPLWARRLRSLHLLLETIDLHEQFGNDLVSDVNAMASATLPTPSWTTVDDRALLMGAYRHGYTQFDAIHTDLTLTFAIDRDVCWPSAQALTARLDRLLSDTLDVSPAGNGVAVKAKPSLGAIKPTDEERSQLFTKRQRVDFMRALMIHGIGRQPDGKIDWSAIRRRDGLRYKQNSSLAKIFQAFCDESAKMAPGLLGSGNDVHDANDADNGVMTRVVAKKFRKRIALMHELRTRVLSHSDLSQLVLSECPPPATTSLPSWWQITHDVDLLKGIARHGIGQWQEMFSDPDFDWPSPVEIQADPARSEPLFNRARQLIKLYSARSPNKTIGPFETRPEDFIDLPESVREGKRRRSDGEYEPRKRITIRISKQTMTIVKKNE